MRIYELAKYLGQKYSTDVKPATLVEEFRTLPQFAKIRDQIKAPASSIDDESSRLMQQIYDERLRKGAPSSSPAPAPASAAPVPPAPSKPAAAATPAPAAVPPRPRPTALVPPPRPAAVAPPLPPRPAVPPRPVSGAKPPTPAPGIPRPGGAPRPGMPPMPPPPGARRPLPLQPGGTAATPPPPAAATATPVAPVASAPAAPPRPVAPEAHRPVAPVAPRPAGTAPAAPSAAAPTPAAPQARPAAPQARPAGGPAQARPAGPGGGAPRPVQPQAGARPGPHAGGRPQGDRPEGGYRGQQGGGRPQQGGPGGPRGGAGDQGRSKFRPSGLASELRSSSGTTGFSAAPDAASRAAMMSRGAGQPAAPPPPKFSGDSPFVARPRQERAPLSDRGPRSGEGGRAGGPPREGRGGERRGGGGAAAAGAAAPLDVLRVPEIGVMKLTPKKGGGKPGAKDKKGRDSEGDKAKRKVAPSKVYGDADTFRRPLKLGGRKRPQHDGPRQAQPQEVRPAGPVILTGPVTVAEFATKLGISAGELIKKAFLKGKPITINQLMNFDLAEEIALDLEIDLQIKPEGDESDVETFRKVEDNPEDMVPRAPVVTIMGHVDHGKTTILDYYRKSSVVEGEFGGITQHIGAYQVSTARGVITFLDTPGHEAFTSMRARGVQCTDIVILVVSADDGVMPQTIEAINHARAAKVPLIVAINKIDLPQADPNRVRNELMQHSVLSTQLGGDTEFVEVSAKHGQNMDALLEMVLLQAEVMELKANPTGTAEGVVIESHIDPLRGAVATVLVQRGTLNVSDIFVVGQQSGRVRAMLDDHGKQVQEAGPSFPVELIGLSGAPEVGEILLEMPDERTARDIAEKREQRRRLLDLGTTRHVTLEGLSDMISDGQIKDLNVILKADVQGSVEAITQSLEKLNANEIRPRVLHSATGPINESDVKLAMASSAIIIGFNIRPEAVAEDLAQREHVEIKLYRIIYELLEDVEKAMLGQLEKRFSEQIQGRATVRQVFRITKVGAIAGCMVASGEMVRGARARLVRDGQIVYDGRIGSLRRVKEDVTKVAQGYECGVGLERFGDVKDGDVIETYTMQEMAPELTRVS